MAWPAGGGDYGAGRLPPEAEGIPAPHERNGLAGGLGLGSVALRLGHFHEALALAGVLTLAGVVGALAGRLALAGVHAFTLDLGFIGSAGSAYEGGREHHRGGGSQGNAGH